MPDQVKSFLQKNGVSLLTSILLVAFNVGIVYAKINQMDKTDIELQSRVFLIEAKVEKQVALEVKIDNLQKSLDEANKRLNESQQDYIKFLQGRGR